MVQGERTRNDVEGTVRERDLLAVGLHERERRMIAGRTPGKGDHLRAPVEARDLQLDAATGSVADERKRDIRQTASDVENGPAASATQRSHDWCGTTENRVRKSDVAEAPGELVEILDRLVHQFRHTALSNHALSSWAVPFRVCRVNAAFRLGRGRRLATFYRSRR
jgi:hypothetical protein